MIREDVGAPLNDSAEPGGLPLMDTAQNHAVTGKGPRAILWRLLGFGFSGLVAIVLSVPRPVLAEEPADEAARAAELVAFANQEARTYTFRREGSDETFALHPEPILKWSNPIAGALYGNVYLWTARGRPEVVASIHKWYSPARVRENEFQSLSLGTFVAERDGMAVWTSGRPGVVLRPFPDAPAPAGTPAQRLRQMRDLSKEFTARQTNRNGIDRDLRLLTQPLYRYEKTEGGLIDGALFVFTLGTDPQAFLLIEARSVDGGAQWQYALARMNSVHLRATYRGREVWDLPTLPWDEVYDHRGPYTNFKFDLSEAAAKPERR